MTQTNPATASSTGMASRSPLPPGPHSLNPLSSTLAFKRDPLSFLTTMSQQYGDIWGFRLLKWPTVVLNHPTYLKHILQEQPQKYDKEVLLFDLARMLFGNGLVTNTDGEHWLRQRRLIQPTFHKERLVGFATTIVEVTLQRLSHWAIICRQGHPLAVMEEMNHLVLTIVGNTFFSTDVSEHIPLFISALTDVIRLLNGYLHLPFPPLFVPTPRNQRIKQAVGSLHGLVDDLIRQRRANQEEKGDLLSMLLQATDAQTSEGMSDQQLHDEVMTFLLGGSETTITALTWICYVLCQYPEVQARLHEEVDRVLGGRLPTAHDLSHLVYTRTVIDETLRLYPPLWFLMRRAVQNDEIGGYHIPKNTFVLWSASLLHRHPDFWEEPETFRPERFLAEQVEKRPRFSYLPFGGGPRICIGNHFALMEMTLILAIMAQRYRLALVPGQVITLNPLLTLQPNKEILVDVRPR